MKKHLSKAYLAAFILLFIVPTLIYEIWGFSPDSATFEKRVSAEKPIFSFQNLENYPKQYEAYYQDNIPFRTQLIKANNYFFLNILNESPFPHVILGKDGWLFFHPQGTDGDTIADYQGILFLTEDELETITENVISIRDRYRQEGKEFILFLAPNKASIYGNQFLPDTYATGNTYTRVDQLVDYMRSHSDVTIVYPKEALLTAINNAPELDFYYKTDTHWNELGGYIGSVELLNALGISMPELSDLNLTSENNFPGDLAAMTGLPSEFSLDTSYTLSGYGENSFQLVEDKDYIRKYTAQNVDPRSILIMRDSYGEAMYPYVASQFQETTFAHRNYSSSDTVSKCQSDIVVYQFVERCWNYFLYYSAE